MTQARSVRSVPTDELAVTAERLGLEHRTIEDVAAAVDAALAEAGAADLVCITGSHYVVGEARTRLAR